MPPPFLVLCGWLVVFPSAPGSPLVVLPLSGIEPVLDALAPLCSPYIASLYLVFCSSVALPLGYRIALFRLLYFCLLGSSLSVFLSCFVVVLGLVPGLSGRRLVQDFQHRPFVWFCLFPSLVRLCAWLGNCQLGHHY